MVDVFAGAKTVAFAGTEVFGLAVCARGAGVVGLTGTIVLTLTGVALGLADDVDCAMIALGSKSSKMSRGLGTGWKFPLLLTLELPVLLMPALPAGANGYGDACDACADMDVLGADNAAPKFHVPVLLLPKS